MKDGKKGKIGLGILFAGVTAAAGATAFALAKKKKREEVYHEAELKAMNELDDLMAESEGCAEEGAEVLPADGVQTAFDDVPEEEEAQIASDDDEPIEEIEEEPDDEPEVALAQPEEDKPQ